MSRLPHQKFLLLPSPPTNRNLNNNNLNGTFPAEVMGETEEEAEEDVTTSLREAEDSLNTYLLPQHPQDPLSPLKLNLDLYVKYAERQDM